LDANENKITDFKDKIKDNQANVVNLLIRHGYDRDHIENAQDSQDKNNIEKNLVTLEPAMVQLVQWISLRDINGVLRLLSIKIVGVKGRIDVLDLRVGLLRSLGRRGITLGLLLRRVVRKVHRGILFL